jgi:hypothetical protein
LVRFPHTFPCVVSCRQLKTSTKRNSPATFGPSSENRKARAQKIPVGRTSRSTRRHANSVTKACQSIAACTRQRWRMRPL